MKKVYSGKQRLAIFLSGTWVTLVGAISASEPSFNWAFFIAAGVFPVGFIWGITWVVAGFKAQNGD